MTAPTKKPMTPAVQAVAALHITGNVIPHVWYQRTEFRTPSGKPDQRMITILADILYWYRPREVRDEDTGALIAFERKFQRDMLQYDYARRGAMFGLEPRPTAEACKALARVGLIRIEYRTLIHGGRPYNNVVFVEPIPDAIKATLTEPNVPDVPRPKKAARGMHARKPSNDTLGVSDLPDVNDLTDEHPAPPLLLNLGPGGEDGRTTGQRGVESCGLNTWFDPTAEQFRDRPGVIRHTCCHPRRSIHPPTIHLHPK